MKFSVGLKNGDFDFLECIIKNKENIREVYFSWGDFPNGRSSQLLSEDYSVWEMMDIQRQMLKRISENDIPLNVLFNGNCYGRDSLSRGFYERVGETVDYIKRVYGEPSVTTTSPLIGKFIKSNFSDCEVRASVNMEISTVQGMDYISEYFDGYYMKREFNRDFGKIRELSEYCRNNGKKLYMLANSGCLNDCSVHNFHDNLVAHEKEISGMDNAYNFTGMCRDYLKNEKNHPKLPEIMNFIRPEDIGKYEEWFDSVKLATRIHPNPGLVLESYIKGKYSGDILRLLEPTHSIYPYVLENGEPLRLVRIGG